VDELDVSWKKKWHETLIFEGGSNVSMNIVKSNFYRDGTLSQPRGGLYLFAMESFRKIISLSANIRAEAIANYKYTPLTGSIGAKTRLSKRSDLGLQSSRNFRYPTFNDLYWQPGGNPNLKPEYSINNEITWHQGIDSLQNSFFEATIFYKDIRNYIQWVPAYQGIWTPENALHVTVTGAEFNFKGTRNCGKTMIKLLANYGYTMALNKEVYQSNSNSLGKQLIYIPPHKFNLSIYALRKNIMLMYNLNFIGYRYITSDNTDYLQGFVLHNIKAGYDKKIGYKTINISGSVNNLLNKNYLLVAARPMPRRSFIFSLSFYL
jgi:iron complex outermembrane receptor protein